MLADRDESGQWQCHLRSWRRWTHSPHRVVLPQFFEFRSRVVALGAVGWTCWLQHDCTIARVCVAMEVCDTSSDEDENPESESNSDEISEDEGDYA